MNSNTLTILFVAASVVLGAILGYFVFLGVYQEQFAYQERITLENFDAATVILAGPIQDIGNSEIVVERDGGRFPLQITEETTIFVATLNSTDREIARKTGRFELQEGGPEDLRVGQVVRIVALFSSQAFRALDITVTGL